MRILRPCLSCGSLTREESRCEACATAAETARHRGRVKTQREREKDSRKYDTTWKKLSARARRIQRYCSDCGTHDDLTTDHSEEAWRAKAEGKPITLDLVDVVCRSCNAKRGKQYVS